MTRKYLNERYCVRCNRNTATPYLRKHWKRLTSDVTNAKTVDLGCGNGRNSNFLLEQGARWVMGVDMAADQRNNSLILGESPLPVGSNTIDVFLANYIFMFLSPKERLQLIKEIKRTAKKDATLMCELYPAKDSEAKTEEEMISLQNELFSQLNWEKVLFSKGRFIAKNSPLN